MASKILVLFLLVACGKDVKVDSTNLEAHSFVTAADSLKVNQSGTIRKVGAITTVTTGGKNYEVSPNSSYVALSYVGALRDGVSVPIKFKGTISGPEIVLELIE